MAIASLAAPAYNPPKGGKSTSSGTAKATPATASTTSSLGVLQQLDNVLNPGLVKDATSLGSSVITEAIARGVGALIGIGLVIVGVSITLKGLENTGAGEAGQSAIGASGSLAELTA